MQPHLYTVVNKERLHELLYAFSICLKMPIQVLDKNAGVLDSCGDTCGYCRLINNLYPKEENCRTIHINAARQAFLLGDTYIFSCRANLNHIIFPIIVKGTLFGSILAGPFLMDTPDSLLILELVNKFKLSTDEMLELYDYAQTITVVSAPDVTQISKLMYSLFSGFLLTAHQQMIESQEKLHQQSKISDAIQMYKFYDKPGSAAYPYEKEKELITKVKTGNLSEAKGILNDVLGYVLFSEGNDLETIKARAVELSSLLSRAAIEGGASTDNILKMNNQFLKSVQTISSIEDLCYKLQEMVEVFTESMFFPAPVKNNEIIKKAILYISNNFSHHITLEEVANFVHLNPAYFSTIFKQAAGSSFKEYLNMVRIEESKRLLANTDYSIINIAISVGFDDQSYFSKVFKKQTGLTPKQYR